MNPAVSIIIPAYNAAAFIAGTIRSVTAQTFSDWELIIVDDGSTDETAAVVAAFLSDSRIRMIRQENAGVSKARNTGIDAASGSCIALLDADDLFLPENLQTKIRLLQEHADCDFVYSNLRIIDAGSQLTGRITAGRGDHVLEHLLLWDGEVIPGGSCSNIVARRKPFDAGLRFDEAFSTAADQDFCFRLAAGYKGKFIPQPLACYRKWSGGMSRNIALMEKDHIAVYRKAAAAGLFHTSRFRRKCFSNMYLILAGSWWVDGNNKGRAVRYMCKAVFTYLPNIFRLFRKLV